MKLTKNILAFYILLHTASSVFAQSPREAIDAFFLALVENQQFSGNVLVLENDKIVYQNAFGYADHSTKIKNSQNISFPIASITKLFTATAILQLSERGLLNINDAASKYLPEFPYSEITIRHLLSHSSGLPPYNAFFDKQKKDNPEKVFTNKDFLPGVLANKQPMVYPPGDRGNYDNVNYLVLALIVEKVSGKTYEEYVKKNILRPAGMNKTNLFPLPEQFNRAEIKNYAYPHVYLHLYDAAPVRSNTIPYVRSYWRAFGFRGFADYVSTTKDLWKFDQALNAGVLLKPETMRVAYKPVKLNNGKVHPDQFGLGWEIEKDTTMGKLVYHSGAAMGLSSNILRNINRHQTVILFDNTHFNAHENALKVMMLLNGKKVPPPRKSIARIYGNILINKGESAAISSLKALQADTLHYYLSEEEMNSLGYDFMGNSNPYHLPEQHFYKQAVETLKTNAELFPNSWNAYDSYAEALLLNGQKDEAIKMYQKSIALNPDNQGGKKALEKILKE